MMDEDQKRMNRNLLNAVKNNDASAVAAHLEAGANVNSGAGIEDTRPLIWAAWNGNVQIVSLLLEAGADKSYVSSENQTPDYYARANGHHDIARMIENYEPSLDADQVVLRAPLPPDRILQENFNFAALERISLVRQGAYGPVEGFTREKFSDVADKSRLREAFAEHQKRGGTRTEEEVFPDARKKLDKPSLS